ncbi:DUF3710 domain-containing protein [Nocardia sp. NPDC057353]|uniref:DUF3710 domain-containing protein n=1 Tax=Nocardia sp. NPDC057353 TaxID=3346104 RepID=UPI003631BE44
MQAGYAPEPEPAPEPAPPRGGRRRRAGGPGRAGDDAADAAPRRSEHSVPDDEPAAPAAVAADGEPPRGPYDYADVTEQLAAVVEQRLDLGSVIIPVPPGGQLQVEMAGDGTPQAVHLATEHGRLTVAAYAAPKTPGQWRTVAADLAESLRKDGAQVSTETGPWGRELVAVTEGADLRFIGVDGYRWMVRLVAAGPTGAVAADGPLVRAARAIMGETVVRRGTEPLPVRDPLPVVLPKDLAEQLAAAHQQQVEAAQAQAQAAAAQAAAAATPRPVMPQPLPDQPRRGAEGSAMQQLNRN